MMITFRAAVLVLIQIVVLVSTCHSANFEVYDATFYKNKPSLAPYGLQDIDLKYAVKFWNYREKRVNPNIPKIIEVSRGLDTDRILVVDIEDWDVSQKGLSGERAIRKYTAVARTIRQTNPQLKFGFYSVLPIRDYWRALGSRGLKEKIRWQHENKRLHEISQYVDYVFPSLYTFDGNVKRWVTYAKENIQQARQYKKPVLVFLWPQFHDSTKLKGEYLPKDFWRTQLETAFHYADGVVIWGGHGQVWDENAAWWQETVRFIETINHEN